MIIYGNGGRGKSIVGNGIFDQIEEADRVFDSWHEKEYDNNYPLDQLTEGLKGKIPKRQKVSRMHRERLEGIERNKRSTRWFETSIDLYNRIKREKLKLLL